MHFIDTAVLGIKIPFRFGLCSVAKFRKLRVTQLQKQITFLQRVELFLKPKFLHLGIKITFSSSKITKWPLKIGFASGLLAVKVISKKPLK